LKKKLKKFRDPTLYFIGSLPFCVAEGSGIGMDEGDLEGLAFPSRSSREARFGPPRMSEPAEDKGKCR
jgi:hypothetical protein